MSRNRKYGRKRKLGAGFFSSIGDALSKANNFLRSTKLISTVGNAISPVLPIAGTIAKGAASLGYGARRRPRRRRARGGNLKSLLAKAHGFVRDKKLISSALSHFGHAKLASAASALGYGKRRKVRRRKAGGAVKKRRVVRRTMRKRGAGLEQIAVVKW